jgi:integral membrane protein
MTLMRSLRAVSLTEGVSYLLLLLVAMPLKYAWGWPLAVKYVGWAHGVLFMTLGGLVLLAMLRAALPFKTACLVGIAALLPCGPFFVDRLLRAYEGGLESGEP